MANDHYLVRSTIRLKLKRGPVTKSTKKKFDTHKLQNNDIHTRFNIQLKNRFQALALEEPMIDEGEEEEGNEMKWNEIVIYHTYHRSLMAVYNSECESQTTTPVPYSCE